jgi:hypothetical protein
MIINSGNPLSPKTYVAFNEVEVNYRSIQNISLKLSTNMHDVLTITMAGIPPKGITDYIDAAVEMNISSGQGRTQEFRGYVMYVEPESDSRSSIVNSSPFQIAKIVCFGVSTNLMGKKQKVWDGVGIKEIASEICGNNHLSLDVFNDTFKLPRLVQAGESDWAFLLRICERYGYSVTVHGTHMHIWDPYKAIGRRPSFEQLIPLTSTAKPYPGGILHFEGTFGYLTPDGYSTEYEMTVLDNLGNTKKIQSTYLDTSFSGITPRSKYHSALVESAQTFEEAEKVLEAKRKQKFPFTAKAQISAGAGIVPGGVVEVVGYNANFEGLWYVREVEHIIGGTTYYSNLMLGKDFNTTVKYVVPPVELAQKAPDSKFVAGEWRASSERVNAYV